MYKPFAFVIHCKQFLKWITYDIEWFIEKHKPLGRHQNKNIKIKQIGTVKNIIHDFRKN